MVERETNNQRLREFPALTERVLSGDIYADYILSIGRKTKDTQSFIHGDGVVELLGHSNTTQEERKIVTDTLSSIFERTVDSFMAKTPEEVVAEDDADLGTLKIFSYIVQMIKPEELRSQVTETFKDILESDKPITSNENFLFRVASVAQEYAREGNVEDEALWVNASKIEALGNVALHAFLKVNPENKFIDKVLISALTEEKKPYFIRPVIRDILKVRGEDRISATIRQLDITPERLSYLKKCFSENAGDPLEGLI